MAIRAQVGRPDGVTNASITPLTSSTSTSPSATAPALRPSCGDRLRPGSAGRGRPRPRTAAAPPRRRRRRRSARAGRAAGSARRTATPRSWLIISAPMTRDVEDVLQQQVARPAGRTRRARCRAPRPRRCWSTPVPRSARRRTRCSSARSPRSTSRSPPPARSATTRTPGCCSSQAIITPATDDVDQQRRRATSAASGRAPPGTSRRGTCRRRATRSCGCPSYACGPGPARWRGRPRGSASGAAERTTDRWVATSW